MVYPATSYLTHVVSLPAPDMIQELHQMSENLFQVSSMPRQYSCIHYYSPSTSITQSSFLALQTFLFHSMLFTHCPPIPFLDFLSTSQWILLFSSPTSRPPFTPCVQTISTHTALLDHPTLVTPVLLCTFSFLTRFIRVTSYIFLPTPHLHCGEWREWWAYKSDWSHDRLVDYLSCPHLGDTRAI